jgi:3-oxoadipate enol-lactonase
LKDITVVGHSLGGLISIALAVKEPSLVSKLVLLGPVKPPPQAGRDGARARALAVREAGMEKVADTVIGNAFSPNSLKSRTEIVSFAREMLSRQPPRGYALALESLANSTDPDWGAVKAKTTIVCGSDDKVSPPALCNAIKDLLLNATVDVVTWDGVGHWHPLENTNGTVEVVRKVVKGD